MNMMKAIDDMPGSESPTRTTEPTAELTAARAAAPAYFSARDMHAYYGESYIVQGVSFDVHEGEILALLGRNGAGKTSTLRAIARVDDPALTQGEIWLDGKALHRMEAFQAARVGVGLVPEDRRIIPGLTVEENLQLAQIVEPKGWTLERIYEHFPRLAERRRQEGVTLSGGDSRCWPSPGRSPARSSSCCWTSPMRAWRPSSCRRSSASWRRSRRWA